MKYKVIRLEDNIYQVFWVNESDYVYRSTVLFQGTLPECDAWISLHEKGYI